LPLSDHWMSLLLQKCNTKEDFLRCVTAAVIYFAISIAAVSKYSDGASKAAGVFGFIATIVYAIDFYITFNDLVTFLKQGSSESPERRNMKCDSSLFHPPFVSTSSQTARVSILSYHHLVLSFQLNIRLSQIMKVLSIKPEELEFSQFIRILTSQEFEI
uniref:Uncharacterized protein n=1 Tax=Meleagris gallopavo TaxID=9103 RepID=G1N3U8_MELGA